MIKDSLYQSAVFLAIGLFLFLTSPTFAADSSVDAALEEQSPETKSLHSQTFSPQISYDEKTFQESLGLILASDSSSYVSNDYRAKQISAGKLLKTSVQAQLATIVSWTLFFASTAGGSSGSVFLAVILIASSLTASVSGLLGIWKLGDLLTSEKYFLQAPEVAPTKILHLPYFVPNFHSSFQLSTI